MKSKRNIALVVAIGSLLLPIGTPIASAETFSFASGPLTNLDPAGAKINGGFTKFPTKAGMYIQQCIAPVGAARPAICSDTIQLWVTSAGGPGTTSPTGSIALTVSGIISGRGSIVDCTTSQCGLFFRYDHTAPTDTSEDKFMPISFRAGPAAPILPSDEVTVTLNGKALTRNVPSNLAYRAETKVVATAKSGLPVTLTSLTADCTVANGVLTALKGAGQCALGHSTKGNESYAASVANYPFILVPGAQQIAGVAKSVKISAKKSLPRETNFGSPITYQSSSKSCSIQGAVVTGKKAGVCRVTASAAGKSDTWNELKQVFVLNVKK
jgi:hypothetical protein